MKQVQPRSILVTMSINTRPTLAIALKNQKSLLMLTAVPAMPGVQP